MPCGLNIIHNLGNGYIILVGISLGRPRNKWEENIKMVLEKYAVRVGGG
jgi:hypothetical protein